MSMIRGTTAFVEQTNEQLVALICAGENVANNMLQLWQQNRGFIYTLVKKYRGYVEEDDLMQEGYLGLCEAVRHYDLEQGVPFVNYSAFWINQVLQRYVDNYRSIVRIPVHMREDIQKYDKFVKEYRKYYNSEPSERIITAFLGYEKEKIESIKKSKSIVNVRSLSEPIAGEDEEIQLIDTILSDYDLEEDCSKRLDRKILVVEVEKTLETLPEDIQNVVKCRYFQGFTMKVTGQQLGITVDQVRQLEAKALRNLRRHSKYKVFRAYHEAYLTASPIYHVGIERFNNTWTSATELLALRNYAEG